MDREMLAAIHSDLNEGLKPIREDISVMKQDVAGLKQDVVDIKIQQQEDHTIIKALKYASEMNNAKIESLTLTVAYIEGRVTGIESDVKELKADVGDIKDAQRCFYEMYGEHETQIRGLRRKLAGE